VTPDLLLRLSVAPVLTWLGTLGVRSAADPRNRRAAVLLLAIAGQENGWVARKQRPVAHARGLYQFESGGGVAGVLQHRSSSMIARQVCQALMVPEPDTRGAWSPDIGALRAAVYDAIDQNDALSTAFARLLLWTDPPALPAIGETEAAWRTYIRNWRPGRPHRDRWDANYAAAVKAVELYDDW